MVKIGRKAPDFEVQAFVNGKIGSIKLSDYLGKWTVLFFYPGDFTFVWVTEVAAVAVRYDEFRELGTEVIVMSLDSPFVHKVWNDQELSKMVDGGAPFAMATDPAGAVGKEYQVFDELSCMDNRGTFIIDPNGVVVAYEILTPPVGRNINETLRQIKAFQLIQQDISVVAPSGWTPGKTTLKPGEDLVGNVWKEWDVKDSDV